MTDQLSSSLILDIRIESLEKLFNLCGVSRLLIWRHQEKRRYYYLLVGTDLFGNWVVERQWGSSETSQGGSKVALHEKGDLESVVLSIKSIIKDRASHGYTLV